MVPRARKLGRGHQGGNGWLSGIMVWVMVIVWFFSFAGAEEVSDQGWPIPDLRGLVPYQISVQSVDGVEKMIERFYTPDGGHVARVSGNGKVYAYAVDRDDEPPIDYLLIDPDGKGKFTRKLQPYESYKIPEWVSR